MKRKPGESIVIDERITVTVLESTDSRVKLGVVAAEDVSVRRVEPDNQTEEPAAEATGETQGEV